MNRTHERARRNEIDTDTQALAEANGFILRRKQVSSLSTALVLYRGRTFVRAFADGWLVHTFIAGMIFQRNGTCGSV